MTYTQVFNYLTLAAYRGHTDTVNAILKSYYYTSKILSATDLYGNNALMLAAGMGHTDIFNTILIHKHSCLKNDTTSKHKKVSLAYNSYFAQNISSQSLGGTCSDVNMTNPRVSNTPDEDQNPPMKKSRNY